MRITLSKSNESFRDNVSAEVVGNLATEIRAIENSEFEPDISPPCIVAWVGDSSNSLALHAKALCEQNADAVATYSSVACMLASPPRLPLSHVLLAQTDRSHFIGSDHVRELKRVAPNAKVLRWLGPLVAPSVGLPGQEGWVESIGWRDSLETLPLWLGGVDRSADASNLTQGLIIVSQSWAIADALFGTVEAIAGELSQPVPVMTWRRDGLTRADRFSSAHVVWDDSVWRCSDEKPCELASAVEGRQYRHIWMTGMASPTQIENAYRSGVNAVWNKPTRRESIEALWR